MSDHRYIKFSHNGKVDDTGPMDIITSLNVSELLQSTPLGLSIAQYPTESQDGLNCKIKAQIKPANDNMEKKRFATFSIVSAGGNIHNISAIPHYDQKSVVELITGIVKNSPNKRFLIHTIRGNLAKGISRKTADNSLAESLVKSLIELKLDNQCSFVDSKKHLVDTVDFLKIRKSPSPQQIPSTPTNPREPSIDLNVYKRQTTTEYDRLRAGLPDKDFTAVVEKIQKAINYRMTYMEKMKSEKVEMYHAYLNGEGTRIVTPNEPPGIPDGARLVRDDGIAMLVRNDGRRLFDGITKSEFFKAQRYFYEIINNEELNYYSTRLLKKLVNRYLEYEELFGNQERLAQHIDISQVYKHDAHSHLGGFISTLVLCQFLNEKRRLNEIVDMKPGGTPVRFNDLLRESGWNPCVPLTPASLLMKGDKSLLGRFMLFNMKFNIRESEKLTKIVFGRNNYLKGSYCAELLKKTLDYWKTMKQTVELRVSINGSSAKQWEDLAEFLISHNLLRNDLNLAIQIPRTGRLHISSGAVRNYDDLFSNIFTPPLKAVLDPLGNKNVHRILKYIKAIDSVDCESGAERKSYTEESPPLVECTSSTEELVYDGWTSNLAMNISHLNGALCAVGLSPWSFRPHCLESGNVSHCIVPFLMAEGICHGRQVYKCPIMNLLFFLVQFPIVLSPRSNINLYYRTSDFPCYDPLPSYVAQGLNCTLSTDDAVVFASEADPLTSEYQYVRTVNGLSESELLEMSANAFKSCCLDKRYIEKNVGMSFEPFGPVLRTNNPAGIPESRVLYRRNVLIQVLDEIFQRK